MEGRSLNEPFLTISEFQGGNLLDWYQAPIESLAPYQWSALEFLNSLSKHDSTFNFAHWNERRSLSLLYTTALTLEYDAIHTTRIVTSLSDMETAFYVVPTRTKANSTLFLFPLEKPCRSARAAKRCASLIAEYLDTPNLSPKSYQPDYRFRLRPDLPIHFRDGTLLNTKTMIAEAQGVVAQIERFSDDRTAY